MPQQSFAAEIDSFVAATKERMEAVFKESAQRTVSLAQSYTPIDTGFLKGSIQGSLGGMPQVNPLAKRGSANPAAAGNITMTIAGATLGQTLFVGYTAAYAGHVEYGTSRMAPRRFVGRAAAQWPATVNAVTNDLKARIQARKP